VNRTAFLLVAGALSACQDVVAPVTRDEEQSFAPQLSIIPEIPVTDLGDLGGNHSIPQAINELGQVIGVAHTLAGRRAFLWRDGSMIDLGSLGGRSTHPIAINSIGQVVGGSSLAGDVAVHPFIWQNGKLSDLIPNDPGLLSGQAIGINDGGQIVGHLTGAGITRSVLWYNGVMTELGSLGGTRTFARGINRAGQVAGTAETASGSNHGFFWHDGVMTDLGTLGGTSSFVTAINDAGQVIGVSETASGSSHGFLWQDGVMIDLGTLGGGYSRPLAINKSGQVVGESVISGGAVHAFFWENGTMTDLGASAEEESLAFAINEVGQVAGYALTSVDQPELGVVWQNGTRIELPPLTGKNSSLALAINRQGQVAGYSSTDGTSGFRATLWTVARPLPPAEQVAELADEVSELLSSGELSPPQVQDLLAKLEVATRLLDRGNTRAAINQLLVFVRMVQADVNAGRLSAADGQALIDGAQRAINQLSPP
jgi:probable HAF family extracellular repeat protein